MILYHILLFVGLVVSLAKLTDMNKIIRQKQEIFIRTVILIFSYRIVTLSNEPSLVIILGIAQCILSIHILSSKISTIKLSQYMILLGLWITYLLNNQYYNYIICLLPIISEIFINLSNPWFSH